VDRLRISNPTVNQLNSLVSTVSTLAQCRSWWDTSSNASLTWFPPPSHIPGDGCVNDNFAVPWVHEQ
jgi:hypothetical protein